jgi:DnaJ-domain-containing protein 1
MGLFDRISHVMRAEWNARFAEGDPPPIPVPRVDDVAAASHIGQRAARRGITDVGSAYRILEVAPTATLDEVRAAYFHQAQRYHPRTHSPVADQAYAAQTVLDALTEALEVVEAHLLPVAHRAAQR